MGRLICLTPCGALWRGRLWVVLTSGSGHDKPGKVSPAGLSVVIWNSQSAVTWSPPEIRRLLSQL
jgi:hypothetical protein